MGYADRDYARSGWKPKSKRTRRHRRGSGGRPSSTQPGGVFGRLLLLVCLLVLIGAECFYRLVYAEGMGSNDHMLAVGVVAIVALLIGLPPGIWRLFRPAARPRTTRVLAGLFLLAVAYGIVDAAAHWGEGEFLPKRLERWYESGDVLRRKAASGDVPATGEALEEWVATSPFDVWWLWPSGGMALEDTDLMPHLAEVIVHGHATKWKRALRAPPDAAEDVNLLHAMVQHGVSREAAESSEAELLQMKAGVAVVSAEPDWIAIGWATICSLVIDVQMALLEHVAK